MSFSQTPITSILPPTWIGADMTLAWTSNPISPNLFQVYINLGLAWYGTALTCTLPWPQETVRIDVGVVDSADATTNYSAYLESLPETCVELNWLGGTFESPEISGFYIYGETTPGGGINYAAALGNVPAYIGGVISDGYGLGGYGLGGYGQSAGSYSWTSDPLAGGLWHFAVVPYDSAGNNGTGMTIAQYINAPPIEVSPYANMSRMMYAYNSGSHSAVLTWNASPSA